MSLVTRCPSCATTFKVVQDQLRISDGWVRCGRCSHVFDASLDLQALAEPAASHPVPALPPVPSPPAEDVDFFDDEPLPEAVTSAPAPLLELPEAAFDEDKDSTDGMDDVEAEEVPIPILMPMSGYDLDVSGPAQRKEPAFFQAPLHAGAIVLPRTLPGLPSIGLVADEPWPQVVTPQFDDPAESSHASHPLIVPAHLREQAANASQVQFQKALRRARDKAAKIAKFREKAVAQNSSPMPLVRSGSETDFEASPEAMRLTAVSEGADGARSSSPATNTIPALLRAASASPVWRSRKGRAWLAAGSVAAMFLLVLQVLHQERDAIVARQPGMRPLLAGVCTVTGCQLSALRQIGDITIDGAAFAREKIGDGYRLSFTLRNAAAVPLAMPAVELSLLDMQEQAVVRRVLLPADFGAPAELAARGERVASMPLALDAAQAASLPPVAGYRLVAFYP